MRRPETDGKAGEYGRAVSDPLRIAGTGRLWSAVTSRVLRLLKQLGEVQRTASGRLLDLSLATEAIGQDKLL